VLERFASFDSEVAAYDELRRISMADRGGDGAGGGVGGAAASPLGQPVRRQ